MNTNSTGLLSNIVYERATATLSECGRYRYRLNRDYRDVMAERSEKLLLWIMLNPSTADARIDDPTIRKCRGFSERLGFGRFSVGNLFAYRATDPKELLALTARDFHASVGPDNDAHLVSMIAAADAVMLAWGSHGRRFVDRCEAVKRFVPMAKRGRLGPLSKEHQPRHPLMLSYDTEVVWQDRDP